MLSRRLVEAQETERRNIARELHDEIGQALTVMQLNLQALLESPSTDALAPRLNETLKVVGRVLEQVQDISLNLRPSMLDDLGLEPALEWLTEPAGGSGRPERRSPGGHLGAPSGSGDRNRMFPHRAGSLDQCGAPRAGENRDRGIARRDGQLHLRVRDDGAGFDVAAVREKAVRGASLGLLSMEERAALAGGGLEFKSSSRPRHGSPRVVSVEMAAPAT